MTPENETKCAYAPAREGMRPSKVAAIIPVAAPARPTVFDPAIAERICEHLAQGQNLRKFCVWPDWPTKKTVVRWMKEHPQFGSRYRAMMRARQKASPNSFSNTRDHACPRETLAAEFVSGRPN